MLVFLYIILILFVHMMPLGGEDLNALAGGAAVRVDYVLHILLFLPWMFMAQFRLCRRSGGGIETRIDTGECLQTAQNTELKPDGAETTQASWRLEKMEIGWRRGLIWTAMGIGLAVGAEGIQYWLPHRGFNPIDALLNALGVLLGAMGHGVRLYLLSLLSSYCRIRT